MEKLIDNILVEFKINEKEIKNYSMLSLAFLGDSIHSLYIRNYLITKSNFKVKELHSMATKYVKAKSQSIVIENLNDLTLEEQQIVKTARNSKTNNIAKNSTIKDYKNATAFESLLGYLALNKNYERLNKILKKSVEITEKSLITN